MVRWQPGARERLQQAALELFATRGFGGVTVAEIAGAAGLTERTFFHYFTDKREVLFSDPGEFEQAFLASLDAAPGHDPMSMIAAALDGATRLFPDDRRSWSRARHRVIAANIALQERELLKLSSLAAALTDALTKRGIAAIRSALAAESGVAVFRTAFATWVAEGEERSFADIQQAVFHELHMLVAEDGEAG